MTSRPIYMDYAATTPVDPRVVDKMLPFLQDEFGNPASTNHPYGWAAEEAIEAARQEVALLINADPREIVWTSGATESNNLALKGVAHAYRGQGKHIVTVKTEHKAVLDTCRELERQGFEVTYLNCESNGLVDLEEFRQALRDDTIVASVMMVNSETGVIQDIAALGEACHEHSILLHVDAAQASGKVPIDVKALNVDLMSFSAHKVYGPKGVGALYIRRRPRIRFQAQMHGGGHERGYRSGTLATHQIVGMGEAFRLARLEMDEETQRVGALRDRLWQGIQNLEGVYLNGDQQQRAPNFLNVSVDYIEGEALIMALSGLAVSSGSACTSASLEHSYVLKALGRSDELAHSSIRFSIGRFTRADDIEFAIKQVNEQVKRLREISPLWEMAQEGVDPHSYQWAG